MILFISNSLSYNARAQDFLLVNPADVEVEYSNRFGLQTNPLDFLALGPIAPLVSMYTQKLEIKVKGKVVAQFDEPFLIKSIAACYKSNAATLKSRLESAKKQGTAVYIYPSEMSYCHGLMDGPIGVIRNSDVAVADISKRCEITKRSSATKSCEFACIPKLGTYCSKYAKLVGITGNVISFEAIKEKNQKDCSPSKKDFSILDAESLCSKALPTLIKQKEEKNGTTPESSKRPSPLNDLISKDARSAR